MRATMCQLLAFFTCMNGPTTTVKWTIRTRSKILNRSGTPGSGSGPARAQPLKSAQIFI